MDYIKLNAPPRIYNSMDYISVQDPLIKRCMEILDMDSGAEGNTSASYARSIWAKIFPKPRRCWIPTGCLKLMDALNSAVPKMSLIALDFSYLPDVRLPGVRAPLISTKKGGSSSDYDSYLEAKGICGFAKLLGTRSALYAINRESITVTVQEVTPRSVGASVALYEQAVGLYASLVKINAYHQPGVEAGKKAAAEVLSLQKRVLAVLKEASQRDPSLELKQ